MNKITLFTLLIVLLLSTITFGQNSQITFEKRESFYPNTEQINKDNIEWGVLKVPENWESPTSKNINLAVAILKNNSNKEKENALVMIEGGPGAGAIEGIWWWMNHPLRENHDIILIDVRGTGFSEPRLCPELGKMFLSILAKNQEANQDEADKAEAAVACKESLIDRGIDINSYNSISIANDLHALKNHFQYTNWNVYGVSYGTHIAQVYTQLFPDDVNTLILDSPISDISEYYTLNTSNYMNSLKKVFESCKGDPDCNTAYPNLEQIFYETIKKLEQNPITVTVEEKVIPGGSFTYNAEDFKIAIHQALYQQKLIEVLPLLIYQFNESNKPALSALVAAFSGALGLDYGMYYCVSCQEAIPNNPIESYEEDVKRQTIPIKGLSFYKSDFVVCDQWNKQDSQWVKKDSIEPVIKVPTLIFTGGFDPITPSKNGQRLLEKIENSQLIEAEAFGHASSFSRIGFNVANDFINNPQNKIKGNDFNAVKTDFVEDVYLNSGVYELGNRLSNLDPLFIAPLGIALVILLIAIFGFVISLFRSWKENKSNKIVGLGLIASSTLALIIITGLVLGLNKTAADNFYILAFGLPQQYAYLFKLLIPFFIALFIAIVSFSINIKKVKNRKTLITVILANLVVAGYFFMLGLV